MCDVIKYKKIWVRKVRSKEYGRTVNYSNSKQANVRKWHANIKRCEIRKNKNHK